MNIKVSRIMTVTLVLGINSVSFADNQKTCVPTKTVEQAKVELDRTNAVNMNTVRTSYQEALTTYREHRDAATTTLEVSLRNADISYQESMRVILTLEDANWRSKTAEITGVYNASTENANNAYLSRLEQIRAQYVSATNFAQAKYNSAADTAAREYNQSVCAK